jgi:hypothetical protein
MDAALYITSARIVDRPVENLYFATTSGFVFAACSGRRSHPMFGLITTISPFEMNFFMPPKASMAARVIVAGFGPVAIMRSDFAAAAQVPLRISRDAGIEKPIPAIAAVLL